MKPPGLYPIGGSVGTPWTALLVLGILGSSVSLSLIQCMGWGRVKLERDCGCPGAWWSIFSVCLKTTENTWARVFTTYWWGENFLIPSGFRTFFRLKVNPQKGPCLQRQVFICPDLFWQPVLTPFSLRGDRPGSWPQPVGSQWCGGFHGDPLCSSLCTVPCSLRKLSCFPFGFSLCQVLLYGLRFSGLVFIILFSHSRFSSRREKMSWILSGNF